MFEPSHPSAAPKAWQNHDLLVNETSGESSFMAMDWEAVPKVDYASSQFRQLAIPEPARVLDDIHEFVMESYGAAQREVPQPLAPVSEPPVDPVVTSEQQVEEPAQASAQEETPAIEEEPVVADEALAQEDQEAWPSDLETADEAMTEPLALESSEPEEPEMSPLDTAAFEQACEEAYQRGLSEGRAAAEQDAQIALAEALAQAADAAATEQARALTAQQKELADQIQPDLALLRDVTQKLEALAENPKQLFEPLKRLSVHLAEQLVLAELNVSGAAIERLVQRCLDELNLHGSQLVTVELNAQDKARLQEMADETLQHVQLQAVPGLQAGSVRVIANDTQVEDLVQHRLEALAHGLLGQPEAWREKSPFFRQPLAHRDSDVQDVAQRPALPDAASDEVLDA